jgi:DNA polymerase-3 subunit beta
VTKNGTLEKGDTMKAVVNSKSLKDALKVVSLAVAKRHTLPITNNVALKAEGDTLQLIATDLEVVLVHTIPAIVHESGSTTVPCKVLASTVKGYKGTVTIDDSNPDDELLTVSCGGSQSVLSTISAEDFPPIPLPKISDKFYIVDAERFKQAIDQTVFCCASEDTRPVLTGVCVTVNGHMELAAADGFRLGIADIPCQGPETTVIIPGHTMSLLAKLLDVGNVSMMTNGERVWFDLGDTMIASQLVQGTFPNYEALIPHEKTVTAILPREEMLQAVNSASPVCNDGSGILRMFGDTVHNELYLSAHAEQVGDFEQTVPAYLTAKKPEEARIAFNVRYLSEMLGAIDTEMVEAQFTTPSSPGLFVPVGHNGYKHLIMPMFIQW